MPPLDPHARLSGPRDLLAPFHAAEKPRARWRVGTEAEKFGVHRTDGSPVAFEGPRGVRRVMELLTQRHGWQPHSEVANGETISLRRAGASITLEPGAQLELSGAPLSTVHETHAELRDHLAELTDVSRELDLAWLGLGFHPLATQAELPWVPKLRYSVMRQYLPTRGTRGLDMMRRTATVQANFDYSDEADALRKLRICLRLSPIVTGLFANSPFLEGRDAGDRSARARVWLDVDPDRAGLLPFALRDGELGYADYVEWALDAPMFMLRREDRVIHNTGQTFRDYLAHGFEDAHATFDDWETHLNTLFPEVRLKRTLELRGADSQSTEMSCALPAVWKGLLYEPTALDAAEKLSAELDADELLLSRGTIAEKALGAELGGRPVAEWARELLSISRSGLEQLAELDDEGRDEAIHLEPIEALAEEGLCPADLLRRNVTPGPQFVEGLLEHAQI
ncbi:MAG: glutamate--cysteine ligase [Deltaproteobacteria bacterium]|nr:glutamate--cysteine ligase [Deltaproteobacteria bacterium]